MAKKPKGKKLFQPNWTVPSPQQAKAAEEGKMRDDAGKKSRKKPRKKK